MSRFSLLLSVALLFIGTLSLQAQAPPGINYQGVARNMEGKPLASQQVTIRVSILQNSESGNTEFMETHDVTTNPFGLFTLVIGKGTAVTGNFSFISWAVGNKWLRIELDPDGGNAFQLMGSQQLMSVPYAFYAQYSGNGYTAGPGISINNSIISNTGDADNNATNELITGLSFGADKKLRITDAGGTKEADLNSLVGAGQNLDQVLTMGNNAGARKITNLATPTVATDAATKAYVDAHIDGDASATNEIQDLALNGNSLTITKNSAATSVNLTPYLDNTDSQALVLTGSNLSITNGNSVNLASLNTDAQTISLAGSNLSISGGNSVDISGINTDNQNLSLTASGTQRTIGISGGTGVAIDVADNDNSVTNEIQDLALSGNTLSITNNASATNINLAPYLDNTDSQDLTLTANTLSLTNDGTSVNLGAYLDNTDSQTLATQSVDANTRSVSISGGNVVNVDVRDADASVTNEIQDLSISGNTLSLSGDATSVNLAGYLDNTDAQTLAYNGATKALSVSGGNSVTITETQTLSQVLTQGADAGNTRLQNIGTPTASNDATTKGYVDTSIATAVATNYAFKAAYSFVNPGSVLSDSPISLADDFDDFNVVASNRFTAPSNGVYSFSITGNSILGGVPIRLKVTSGTVTFFDIKRQVGYPDVSVVNYLDSIIYKLNAGDTIELVVTSAILGQRVEGFLFGSKL